LYELARHELLGAGYHANPGKNAFVKDLQTQEQAPILLAGRGRDAVSGHRIGGTDLHGFDLAYGQGAASKRLEPYLEALNRGQLPIQDLYDLPLCEGMAKMLSVSFYFGEIDLQAFRIRFGVDLVDAFSDEVSFVLSTGLMEFTKAKLRLTEQGAKAFPGVVALFYSDAVKAHLHALEGH